MLSDLFCLITYRCGLQNVPLTHNREKNVLCMNFVVLKNVKILRGTVTNVGENCFRKWEKNFNFF